MFSWRRLCLVEMIFTQIVLAITALAYIWASLISVFTNKSFMQGINHYLESVFFIFMGLLVGLTANINNEWFLITMASIYVIVALLSYKGVQNWGSVQQNLFMTLWDLTLAGTYLWKLA